MIAVETVTQSFLRRDPRLKPGVNEKSDVKV